MTTFYYVCRIKLINMKIRNFLLVISIVFSISCISCKKVDIPHTERTDLLINELLTKLDSTDIYAARKLQFINSIKSKITDTTQRDLESIQLYKIADEFASYSIDSSLLYLDRAIEAARKCGNDSLRVHAELKQSAMLTSGGFYVAAKEVLESTPRNSLKGQNLISYYSAWTALYHELYSSYHEPEAFEHKYRRMYNIYRDSLLMVSSPHSTTYLRNMERKEARVKNIAEAVRYNDERLSIIKDKHSTAYATCLYDRYLISAHYEGKLTGEAVDNLLMSAIIEVENCNYDIASLFRLEALLNQIGKEEDAKRISDFYHSSVRRFGSRKRLIDGGEQAIEINESNFKSLQKKNNQFVILIIIISLLTSSLIILVLKRHKYILKITNLNNKLKRSSTISEKYVGVTFKLYSSYIKRLEGFRTKLHSNLKRGNIENALDLTSPSSDITSDERRILFHNFDSAFIDIYPNYIEVANSCLKPEERITPKRTEILNNELRIQALIKLGIEDTRELADLLHCSVKTVYNLRSAFKMRLNISEQEFQEIISKL